MIFKNANDIGYFILAIIIFASLVTFFLGLAVLVFICVFIVSSFILWYIYEDIVPMLPYLIIMTAGFIIYYFFDIFALIMSSIVFTVCLVIVLNYYIKHYSINN